MVSDAQALVLDLEAGSLAVYVNRRRLGLMVPQGLRPPLRWAAALYPTMQVGLRNFAA